MRFGKLFVVGSVLLIVALLIAGCARATPAPKPTATPAPAAPTPTPVRAATPAPTPAVAATAPAPTPTAVAKPKPEGLLRVGRSSWLGDTIDPYAGTVGTVNQVSLVFDALVGATPDRLDISPDTGLAYKWEQSPDLLTWTFYLRKGVQFDKGWGEVTAEDVKFSLERVVREGTLATLASTLKKQIKSIEVVDPYTVRFQLNVPAITLAYDLSFIRYTEGAVVSKKYLEKVGDKEFAINPIGSGPYRLVKLEPGLYFKFEARPDYWAGAPRFKEVYLFTIPEEATRLAMLKTGQLEVIDLSIPRLKEVEAAGFRVFAKVAANVMMALIFNEWEGANADIRVRQALNIAINRQEMLDSLFQGRGRLLPGILFPWELGSKPFAPYPYDPKRAKELLAEAGYAKGLELRVLGYPKEPAPLIAQAMAGYYEAVGIKTKVIIMDSPAIVSAWRKGEYINSVFSQALPNRLFTVGFWQATHHSKGYLSTVRDPKLDALIEAGERAKDLAELGDLQGRIEQHVYENFQFLPLFELGEFYAVSPKLGIEKWGAGGKSLYEVGLSELLLRR